MLGMSTEQLEVQSPSFNNAKTAESCHSPEGGEASVVAEPAATSRVAILLCTYHGQHYLAEQLDSFAAQTYANWEVRTSDDGSQDNTRSILEAYKQKWPAGRLHVNAGPAQGFAANFLSLTCNASIEADFYAYSDQDDIWDADKLARAVQWLESVPAEVPALLTWQINRAY